MIFGTLKDSSLKFNDLPFLIFSATEMFCKMALKVFKNGFKKVEFLSKTKKIVHFEQYDLVQILPACA